MFKAFLKKRLEPTVFTGLPLTLLVIVFVLLFATLLGITDAIVNSAAIVKIDAQFAQYLYHLRTPASAKLFYAITHFADQTIIGILLACSCIYLFFKKELAYLYAILITFIGTEGSVYLTKILINRARPGSDIAYYIENSKSFPSGHAAVAMAVYGFITYYLICHNKGKSKKSLFIILGAILVGLIGFSRLYLGVHYLSDVLGGFIMGGLWLIVGITFRERHFYTKSIKKGVNPALKI